MAVSVISMAIGGYLDNSGGCHLSFSNFSCQPRVESERSDSIIIRLYKSNHSLIMIRIKGFCLLILNRTDECVLLDFSM